ncbi:MAG: NYN domain-containing protein [Desulfovibrio sp.]|nr:NYN domain-containing protein [Desulfovibrio sp.]
MSDKKSVAILIDAENFSYCHILELLKKCSELGDVKIIRAYGDFSTTNLKSWLAVANAYAIRPVQQNAYRKGKSAADMALIVDAMDIYYGSRPDVFCIASSDSDYAPLCVNLREKGIEIHGFGYGNAQEAFRSSCKSFCVMDGEAPEPVAPVECNGAKPIDELLDIIDQAVLNGGGSLLISAVGMVLRKECLNFSPKDYGHSKLFKLLEAYPDRYLVFDDGRAKRVSLW